MLTAMTGMMRTALAVAAASLLLTSCSEGDPEQTADTSSSGTSTSATPEPAESDDCRSTMDQADAIATELDSAAIEKGTTFRQFEDRLTALYKQAATDCSPRVTGDFAAALDSMARVSARYTACSFSDPMFECDVADDLVKGAGLVHDAAATAYATN